MSAETGSKRAHVFYAGTVQGVGFRYTAWHIAEELNVSGWVKNLPDGRVELLAEGSEEEIQTFLARIKNSSLGRYITRDDVQWSEASGREAGFEIRYF